MSIVRITTTVLKCDMDDCGSVRRWPGVHLVKTTAEALARREGWRKDKLGRNVCRLHPKLKGARS